MTSIAGLLTWFGICAWPSLSPLVRVLIYMTGVTYIRFYAGLKVQGIDRKTTLPYYTNLQPFAAWYGAVWCIVICFVRIYIVSPVNAGRNLDHFIV